MPSPKSGNAGNAIDPKEPQKAFEADKADPGEVDKIKAAQIQSKSGKYGSVQLKPFKNPNTSEESEEKKNWIEIEMVGEDGSPVVGEAYRIILPDGKTAAEGTLDEKGCARISGIEPGNCKISFINLDQEAWVKM